MLMISAKLADDRVVIPESSRHLPGRVRRAALHACLPARQTTRQASQRRCFPRSAYVSAAPRKSRVRASDIRAAFCRRVGLQSTCAGEGPHEVLARLLTKCRRTAQQSLDRAVKAYQERR